jgi:hypothetical protein
MFALSRVVLLMNMRTLDMMGYAYMLEETMEFFIFTSPVGLHGDNFLIKPAFYIFLEIKKNLEHFGMFLEQINPGKLAKIINESFIICMFARRHRSRIPHMRKNLLIPREQ